MINVKAKFQKKPELCVNKQLDNEKELFTAADNSPSAEMGTDIASLDSFSVQETEDGFYSISLRDLQGNQSSFFLHSGSPVL